MSLGEERELPDDASKEGSDVQRRRHHRLRPKVEARLSPGSSSLPQKHACESDHPDLLLSRRNTLASLNIQDIQTGAELVAAQTSSVDHQTTLVEFQHNS
jgi:hypothetical protein